MDKELEQPEVVALMLSGAVGVSVLDFQIHELQMQQNRYGGEIVHLMTVAQHERIVANLEAKCDRLRNQALGYSNQLSANRTETERLEIDLSKAVAERDALATQLAELKKPINRTVIRDVFLRNGFTIKDGQTDLKPYVYAAAEELLRLDGREVAPAQQAEQELNELRNALIDAGVHISDHPALQAVRVMLAAAPQPVAQEDKE